MTRLRFVGLVFLLPSLACQYASAPAGSQALIGPYVPVSALACEATAEPTSLPPQTVVSESGQFPVAARHSVDSALIVFRGRGSHVSSAGRLDLLVVSRSGTIGRRLAPPELDSPLDDRNPAIEVRTSLEWWLAYTELTAGGEAGNFDPKLATFRMRTTRSIDGGASWSKPQSPDLIGVDSLFLVPFGRMHRDTKGFVLLSAYTGTRPIDRYHTWHPLILQSTDGIDWSVRGRLPTGFSESALVIAAGDTIASVMRSTRDFLAVTVSADAGRTWTTPARVTEPHEVGADLVTLPNDELLLVYGRRVSPKSIRYRRLRRYGMSFAASAPRTVALIPDETLDLGYPSVLTIGGEGSLNVVYYVSGADTPESTEMKLVSFCPVAD